MGEEKEEIGQFRVGQGMSGCDERLAKFLAGGQGQAKAAKILVPIPEAPPLGPCGWWFPSRQELLAVLAQFSLQMGQKQTGPVQRPFDPAVQLSGIREAAGQFRQREPLGQEGLEHADDLAEAGRFVRQMGAGSDAAETATRQHHLLDGDGVQAISGMARTSPITAKGADLFSAGRTDQCKPVRMVAEG